MNKNKIIIIVLSILIVIASFIIVLLLINKKSDNVRKSIYGTVVSKENNYVVIKTPEGENIDVELTSEVEEGSLINITYEDNKPVVEVIANKDELLSILPDEVEDVTTTTTTKAETINITTTTKKQDIKETTTTTMKVEINKDDEIISYLSTTYNDISNDKIKENKKLKNYIIEFVDFIFYDTPIKGIYFKDLTNTAKAKVIYFVLLMDSKIDSLIPNYKDSLSEKYNSIKGKLVAKYLEITANICDKHKEQCTNLKDDFNDMKETLSISWSFIKDAYTYASDKTVTSITNWYKIWSGKE